VAGASCSVAAAVCLTDCTPGHLSTIVGQAEVSSLCKVAYMQGRGDGEHLGPQFTAPLRILVPAGTTSMGGVGWPFRLSGVAKAFTVTLRC